MSSGTETGRASGPKVALRLLTIAASLRAPEGGEVADCKVGDSFECAHFECAHPRVSLRLLMGLLMRSSEDSSPSASRPYSHHLTILQLFTYQEDISCPQRDSNETVQALMRLSASYGLS
jgi:hypothetical protein